MDNRVYLALNCTDLTKHTVGSKIVIFQRYQRGLRASKGLFYKNILIYVHRALIQQGNSRYVIM